MNAEDEYVRKVIDRLPAGALRKHIEADLRGHIGERVERGHSVEEALRQLGDPALLAQSYLSAVPLVTAPLGRRIAAKIVDLVIFGTPPLLVFMVAVPYEAFIGREELQHPIFYAALYLALIAATWVYVIVAEYLTGQTIGKKMFGLQVVTESGGRIGLGQSFVRQLPLLLEIAPIDLLFVFFNDKRQRGFEMISKTRVVTAPALARDDRMAVGSPA